MPHPAAFKSIAEFGWRHYDTSMEKRRHRDAFNGRVRYFLCATILLTALVLSLRLGEIQRAHNCRLWGMVAQNAPGSAILDQLLNQPNSLKTLSILNPDGWGVGYYTGEVPACTIERSQAAACLDPRFDTVVAELAAVTPRVAVAHVRNCSSGLCDIPNPHPFERVKGGVHWLMGHNGTIPKEALLALIRPEYLAANPPQYGANQEEWIDSDLYFIALIQAIEDHGYDVKPAIGEVIEGLWAAMPDGYRALNFFLTDGSTLWAYREGYSLYFTYESGDTAFAAIASQYPSSTQGDWVMMENGQLVTLSQDGAPEVENIEAYFEPLAVDGGSEATGVLPRRMELAQNYPNPFNASTSIAYSVPSKAEVTMAVYDVLGRKVRTLVNEIQGAGRYVAQWDGKGEDGVLCASGVYFCLLGGAGRLEAKTMLMVK